MANNTITYKTTPGINNQVNIKSLSVEERRIIRNLSQKYWYVTRVEEHHDKKSSYRVAFLKPVEYVTQNFNLTREVVMILTPYSTFEPRTLDVLDNLDIQKLRLEEICCLVASKDTNIESVLNNFLKSNTESRIFVPFTYDDFINPPEEMVINRMRRCFYSRDLFGIQEPLRKELYFFW